MSQDLEHGHEGVGEGGEVGVVLVLLVPASSSALPCVVVLQVAEELHGDAGGDEQQVDGEHDQAAQLLARAEDLVDKVLEHGAGLHQANDPQHLEDRDRREEEAFRVGQHVDRRHDCQEKLKLVDAAADVALEAQAEYLEESLKVVEDDKADLSLLLPLKEMLSWQTVLVFIDKVLETDGGGDDGVRHGDAHDKDEEDGRLEDRVAELWSKAFQSELVNSDQVPP